MKSYRPVLNGYLVRTYVLHLVALLGLLVGIVALFDALELMRRFSKGGEASNLIGYLTLLKIPENILMLAPFVILFSAMFTLSILNRRNEFMVMRTAGASLWQLMIPFFAVAFLFGTLLVGVINPLSAVTNRSYLAYEEKFLKKESHIISLLGQGLWLRQSTADETGYVLLHASKVALPSWKLNDVVVLFFDNNHYFLERLDAPVATLSEGRWFFPESVQTKTGVLPTKIKDYSLATTLTPTDLEESFSTPETISFWKMFGFIRALKTSGFPVLPLQVHFATLLIFPFLCVSLTIIAVPISISPARSHRAGRAIGIGILLGFVIFFTDRFLQALGSSGQIPVWLSAIGPVFLTSSGGILAILSMEDR